MVKIVRYLFMPSGRYFRTLFGMIFRLKQTSYWSQTGFFSVCQLTKVNNNEFSSQNFVISYQNNVQNNVQDNNEQVFRHGRTFSFRGKALKNTNKNCSKNVVVAYIINVHIVLCTLYILNTYYVG